MTELIATKPFMPRIPTTRNNFAVCYGDEILYQAQDRQHLFHWQTYMASEGYATATNILYGGAAGGGKTEALLWEIYRWGVNKKWPKLKIAVFRKTFPEIEKYFINRAFDVFPNPPDNPVFKYNVQKHILTFIETGTIVEFNTCEAETDVNKYQGAQWDILIIDEATHFSEYVYKYLKTRLRTKKKGWRCLFLAATNPGNVGHAWVKRLFVKKDDYKQGEGNAERYTFIPAKVYDNRYIMQYTPEYVDALMALPEYERRALLEGDWNIYAGQYFTEIRDEIHGFEPFLIPNDWGRFIAFDYGYFPHPASAGWYAIDENGFLIRYKELLVQRATFRDFAQMIIKMSTPAEKILIGRDYVIGDPSIWAKKGNAEGKSGAEEMQEEFDKVGLKWLLIKADNDRINGWNLMHSFLKPFKTSNRQPGQPQYTAKFRCALTCKGWWKSVPQLQHDPNRPEDVKKIGVVEGGNIADGDDPGDESRYAIMSRFSKPESAKRKAPELDRYGAVVPERAKKTFGTYMGSKPEVNYNKPDYQGL